MVVPSCLPSRVSVGGPGVSEAVVFPVGIDLVGEQVPYYYTGSVGSRLSDFEPSPVFLGVDAWEGIDDDMSSSCAVCGDPVEQTGQSGVRTSTCPCCRWDGFCLSKPVVRRQ